MPTIDVKDAAAATVALERPNANGQQAMAASRPVVIASDQSALPVKGTRSNAGSDTATGAAHLSVGGSDGTNLRPLLTNTDGSLKYGSFIAYEQLVVNSTGVLFGGWIDVADTHSWEVQYHNSGVACNMTAFVEFSNDQSTIINSAGANQLSNNPTTTVNLTPTAGQAVTTAIAATAQQIAQASHYGRYIRLRIAWTSGSATFRLHLKRSICDVQKAVILNIPAVTVNSIGVAATTSGAASTHGVILAAGNNATSVKATAACLNELTISNASATTGVWLKIYASTTAPTPGSGTPVRRYFVKALETVGIKCGSGVRIATGLAYCVTTGGADSDTGGISANEVAVNISYA